MALINEMSRETRFIKRRAEFNRRLIKGARLYFCSILAPYPWQGIAELSPFPLDRS